MKNSKHEAELFKAALLAGVRYAEDRGYNGASQCDRSASSLKRRDAREY